MRAALLIACYTAAVAWVLPLPLRRLSAPGLAPRLGLAAWLTAVVGVLACAMAALGLLTRTAIAGWPAFARTVCESVSAGPCPPTVYRSAAYELGLAAAAFLGGVAMILIGWRYGRRLRQAGIRTRSHADAARITGHPVDGAKTTFVLDDARPAAYSLPGRPPAIVLTTGALAVLDAEQLTAVLAHERAHLAGRHHLLLAATRSLAAVAPAVPLFARASGEVTRLAEMRADDVAARHSARRALLAALLSMSAQAVAVHAPTPRLAVTGGVVAARVRRLADPPAPARCLRHGLLLAALILAVATASTLVPLLAVSGT
jgi:Zn-dependent protease with chaperone function